ncbi:MAG: YqgE/AlgH family protein [Myxococcales bacterium]|nr:YqgE/AlgH family protein [Myxococcales bacterium]
MESKLAPGFLVAAPSLLDPNFKRSVVLLVDHRPEGSLGLVINRVAQISLSDVLTPLGLQALSAPAVEGRVMVGGPVAPDTGWLIFEQAGPAPDGEEVVRVSERLAVSASREVLERLIARGGDERMQLLLGYSGWGPGQLDAEIAQGSWIPVDFDESIVFDIPAAERWTRALGLLGIDPARLTLQPPSEN